MMAYIKGHLDKVGAWVAIMVGVFVLAVGWNGVWHTLNPGEQIPYIVSGGIGGMFLLGLGALLWLSSDLRQERGHLDSAARHLKTTGSLPPAPVATSDRQP